MELKWVSGTSTPWYRTSRPLRGMVPDPPLGLAPHSVQRADPSPLGYPLITESRYKFSARTRKQVRRPHFSAPAPSASAAAASTGAAAAEASPTVLACNRSSSRRCRPSFAARAWPLSAVALVDHLFDRRAEEGELPVVVALDDARQQRRPTQRRDVVSLSCSPCCRHL